MYCKDPSKNCALFFKKFILIQTKIARKERTESELASSLQLNCQCYILEHQREVKELRIIGLSKPTVYDQYVSASQESQFVGFL